MKRPGMRPCFVAQHGIAEVTKQRRAGIAKACAALAIEFSDSAEYQVKDPAAIDGEFIQKIMADGCDTVFAFNDLLGVAVVQAAMEAGISIPQQLSVMGYDDAPVRSLMRPRLATMSMPVAAMAERAGAWIQAVIVNKDETLWQEHLSGVYCPGETIGGPP